MGTEAETASPGDSGTHSRARVRWMLPGLLAVAAGCAVWSARSSAPSSPARASAAVIAGALSQQDLATVSLADQMLLQSCMRSQGFQYSLFGTGSTRPPATPTAPFGQSVQQAEADGYGGAAMASELSGEQPPDQNADYTKALSPAELARYETAAAGPPGDQLEQRLVNGSTWTIPSRGCQADAYVRLYGSLQIYAQYFTFSEQVAESATQEADADPTYKSAQRSWAGCVSAAGYRAANPTDLMDQALAPYSKPTADLTATRKRETAIAVAAARCNSSAGLEAAFTRAEQDNIDRMVALNAGADAAYRRTGRRALAVAEAIVAGYRADAGIPGRL